jgi:Tol biopolymer transport system component
MIELDRAGLNRILPAAPGSTDWDDVLRRFRAHRSRRRRRTMVTLAVASLAVVLLVVPALGLGGRLLQLITSPGTGPEVWGISWSPDGTRLAFHTGWVDDTGVYVLSADGSSWRMTRIGKGTAEWPHPAWSPDGELLAFVGAGKRGIHVVKGDGGGRRTVARTRADVTGLVWSPDGRKLAFLTSPNAPDGHREASLVNLDGRGRRNLWRDWGLVELPVWSPDGRMIAFTARSGSSTDRAIYVANADWTGQRRLAQGAWPRWSPDGRRIAFQVFPSASGARRAAIHVVNIDGSGRRRIAQDGGGAAWSPDGRRIAFMIGGGQFAPPPDVYVVNADGSGQRRLTRDRSSGFNAWSPDGRKILYVSARGNNEIYVVRPDGSGRRNLTRNPTFDGQPAWSPDGRRVAFSSKRDGKWGIYLMNADGSGQQRLAQPRP